MKKIIAILLLAQAFSAVGQEQAQDQLPDSVETAKYKNEIWVNGISFFLALAQSPLIFPEYSLMFKRNIGKSWLRLGAYGSPPFDDFSYGIQRLVNDSTLEERTRVSNIYHVGFRAGMEFRKQKKLVEPFLAMDAVFDYRRSNSVFFNSYYSVSNNVPFPEIDYTRTKFIERSADLYKESSTVYFGGLSVSGGLILPVSNRIALSAQAYLHIGYSYNPLMRTELPGGETIKLETGEIEFHQNLIQEINFIYRF